MSRLTNAGCLLYFIQEQPKEAAYVQSMWPISRHGGDSPLTGRWFYTGLNGFKFWCGKNNLRGPFSFEKGVSHQEDCNSEATPPLHCSCTHPENCVDAGEEGWLGGKIQKSEIEPVMILKQRKLSIKAWECWVGAEACSSSGGWEAIGERSRFLRRLLQTWVCGFWTVEGGC